jgi:hypothetical protein
MFPHVEFDFQDLDFGMVVILSSYNRRELWYLNIHFHKGEAAVVSDSRCRVILDLCAAQPISQVLLRGGEQGHWSPFLKAAD